MSDNTEPVNDAIEPAPGATAGNAELSASAASPADQGAAPLPAVDDSTAEHPSGQTRKSPARRLGMHVVHPVMHVLALISLHVVALGVIEKTPLLTLLLLH